MSPVTLIVVIRLFLFFHSKHTGRLLKDISISDADALFADDRPYEFVEGLNN